ncbi:Fe-S cluster assembly protein SufD [Sneathiella chungangensis]|uniref:Fe-S cluster assembly protein SufD n=1 Tax=Sneathiella chungangensis TaxID=1418234 RepID=A0A845MBD6_9PROT|nr:Fe-S cluster assembly protein SufD [Sneathiella chungangensis]MZR20780.1 Fe-S cluster assembly protein SufD [Sneathiella chungangensis]
MKTLTPLAQTYLDRFDAARSSLPGHQIPVVAALRETGFARFKALDFPGRKVEEWRFTNLAPLTKGIEPAAAAANADLPAAEFDTPHVMTFINGRFSPNESHLDQLPEGIKLSSLAAELDAGNSVVLGADTEENRPVVALNTAFMADGFVLQVEDGVTLDAPLLVRFVSLPGSGEVSHHLRNVIRLGKGAATTLLEEHVGIDGHAYFANPVTDITLAEGATLRHYKYQAESDAAFHLANTDTDLATGATYENFALTTGARLARNELESRIMGAGATSILNGAYLIRGQQHADTTTLTRHLVPENDSKQVYKGILDGEAQGVFQGKIQIVPDAQKVSGDQLSRALLLSDRASVSVKPELEIHADDVKCSHGASSGELDEDALFYLQSRGIEEKAARKMLIDAFLADVLEEISDDAVRTYFAKVTARWMEEV